MLGAEQRGEKSSALGLFAARRLWLSLKVALLSRDGGFEVSYKKNKNVLLKQVFSSKQKCDHAWAGARGWCGAGSRGWGGGLVAGGRGQKLSTILKIPV